MNPRKKLTDIQEMFAETPPATTQPAEPPIEEDGSLTALLKQPKKKPHKIRFTLDLEKPLDDRLNKASSKLNRSKADLARIALEQLLDNLEQEWK